ncbi:hypothetical protein [Corynebacterium halotolerans]|uniref:hypothetical protein n=1 Tax=Corynebacterium halotolerans TaxID=225326 RepID=UPI003CE81D62
MRSLRPFFAFPLVLTTTAALTACTSFGGGARGSSDVAETVAGAGTGSPAQQPVADAPVPTGITPPPGNTITKAYSDILDNSGKYSFTGGADYSLNGEYEYALVEMSGDDSPELLVKALTTDHIDPIRVFSTTADGALVAPGGTLVSGAAGAGGYRAGVSAAPEGDRIFQTEWHSLRPEVSVRGFLLEGGELVPNGETWEDDQVAPSGDLVSIAFHPLHDRQPIEATEPGAGAVDTGGGGQGGRGVPGPSPTLASAEGNTVTGTVRVLTAPELAEFQGLDQTPNGEDSSYRFAVFILDSPAAFSAKSSGNAGAMQEREAAMVLLGAQTPHTSGATGFDLKDQHLTLSFDQNGCWFPSDASLPLGQPRCGGFTPR